MPNLPISGLTASASNAAATDVLPVVQTTGTGPVKMTVQQIAGGLLGSTTLTGATVTTNSPVLNLAQTWNESGVTFTAVKMNVIDTISDAASLLMDLQVGGTSQFKVYKGGRIDTLYGVFGGFVFSPIFRVNTNTGELTFGTSSDTILTRRTTANLQIGAADTTGTTAPTPQFLSAQSWASSTTSNQLGANFTIDGSQGTGTGAGGSIVFRVAPAGVTSNGVQNGLSAALTLTSTGRVHLTASTAGLYFNTVGFVQCGITPNGLAELGFTCNSSTYCGLFNNVSQSYFVLNSSASLAWSSTSLLAGAADVILARDAANTLALRNSTAAQAFNIYNTYTSSTSYERYSVDWITTANLVIVGPNKGSVGGTQRVQRLSYLEDGGAGSTVPLLGSTCPAASGTVKSWIKIITSDGTTAYVPCWA